MLKEAYILLFWEFKKGGLYFSVSSVNYRKEAYCMLFLICHERRLISYGLGCTGAIGGSYVTKYALQVQFKTIFTNNISCSIWPILSGAPIDM